MKIDITHETSFNMMMLFVRINKKFNELEKFSIDIGNGEKLYPSELHILDAIGNDYAQNVTDLSKKFGITKGAVSQVVNKLFSKDFLLKERKKGYGNEVKLILTEKGLNAFKIQNNLHKKMEEEFFKHIGSVESEKIDSFNEIMYIIEEFIDSFLKHEQ
jgi:DNA-binding MarR family transcriptional regulator